MNSMISWFARNGVAANLLMLLILGAGLWSMKSRIPLEVFPTFERDVVNVAFTYPGATPLEVEQSVILRAEEAIADIEGIEKINSTAYEGAARLRIELEKGNKPRELLDDIKNKIDALSTLPEDVDAPNYSVSQFRREVISIAISGNLPPIALRRLGEKIKDDIAALPEINFTELSGTRSYEIAIEISPDALEQYNLSLQQVAAAIRQGSVDIPAGSIKTSGGEVLLRTTGLAHSAQNFADVILRSETDGTHLRLGDIAHINDQFEETPLETYFNEQPAVIIEVYRSGQQNAIKVAQAVKDYIASGRANLPVGVTMDYWRDRSRIVNLRLQTLLKSAWQGGLLVFICLALFLRFSVALWVCLGIPVSFMGAMILMPQIGVSFNIISLFAFIMVLGIVVDDAIITGENIYSQLKKGKQGLNAAIQGAQEVAVPVTYGLLTTVMAFVPLAFLGGFRGPIFAQLTYIVTPVLLFSWVESKLILPTHLSHIRVNRKIKLNPWQRFQRVFSDGLESFVERFYQPLLERCLRYRYLTIAVFIAISMIIASYFISGRYGFTFFPRVDSETARVTLTMQAGTPAQTTAKHVLAIADAAKKLQTEYIDPETGESIIQNILSSVGWKNIGYNPNASGNAETGQVSLELMPPEARTQDISTRELVKKWRKMIGDIPGARSFSLHAEIGRGGEPVDVQLIGNNAAEMQAAVAEIRARLGNYPGLFNIQDTLEDGKTQIQLTLKPEANLLGISVQALGEQLRQAYYGIEVQRLQRGKEDVRVLLRYPSADRSNLASLALLKIRSSDGTLIPLANVADLHTGQGASSIRREDQKRVISVFADADKKEVDIQKISLDLATFLNQMIAQYPNTNYEFSGELKEQKQTFDSLRSSIIFMLFAIYGLLAIPLKSYFQPFVVMLIIPFSVIGALIGHMIMGMGLSLPSILGMLALAGVGVNDSLVLVDWINRRRAEGLRIIDAVRTAGAARFRPILLTSLTTFFGLSPLMLEKSTQAQFLIPMGVSLGFGILYATFLSLILVPSAYLILDDARRFFRWVYQPETS